ncbi:DUF4241 domain-containing protein [Helicobacter pylori]|nr:DUF4241 domain-containing protein [Helicobacter pylori]
MVKVELLKHLFFDKLFSGFFLGELVACDPLITTKAREPFVFLTLKILIILTRQSKRKR